LAQAQQYCPADLPRTTPDADFVDTGNGTVLHVPTGLMWKRCAERWTWDGSTCTTAVVGSAAFSWDTALARVDAVNAGTAGTQNAGYTDWRLPNVKELASIVEWGCGPAINLNQFPAGNGSSPAWASYYFSGTPFKSSIFDVVWGVEFVSGIVAWDFIPAWRVRLVRNGTPPSNFDAAAPAAATTTGIPTLSEWGAVLLSVLLGAVAWWGVWRRDTRRR
jgi:hypothetical protein